MTVRSRSTDAKPTAGPRRPVERDFERFRARGDTRALARVFDELAPDLLLVAAHLGRDASEAEDLLQSTFVTAIERRHAYDRDRPLRAWLVGILAIQHRRQRRLDARTPDPDRTRQRTSTDPSDAAAATEFAEAMERALSRLPPHYRQPLNLRLLHGLSVAEIAHASGCAPATVKTRLQRGLAQLRRALPAGLGSSLAVTALPERGLAAVRQIVLAGARDAVAPTVAATPAVVAGVLIVKQLSLAALAVAMIAAGWWAFSDPTTVVAPPAAQRVVPDERATVATPAATPTPTPNPTRPCEAATPPARELAASTTATATALHVHFVWSEGGDDVVNHTVQVQRLGDPPANARMLTTDARGRVDIDDARPGTYRFARRSWTRDVEAVRGEVVERTLQLDGLIHVEGVVRDARARPVGGAAIRFTASSERQTLATTAADGTFATRLTAGGQLWVEAAGFLPSTARPIAPTRGERHTLVIELDVAGHWFGGQVVSADGVPVAGARLALETDGAQGTIRGPAGDRQLARPPLVLTAGEDGRFETRCAPSGARRMLATAPGHGPVVVELSLPMQRSLTVKLARPASIRGTLRDAAGTPLAGGHVGLQWRTRFDGVTSIFQEFLCRGAPVDDQGRYRLQDLPAGAIHLVATSGRLPRIEHDVELAAGEEAVWDPTLRAGTALSGRLVDVDGAAVAGWRIAAQARDKDFRFFHATTDADGWFRFAQLPDVDHDLRARPPKALGDAARLVWGKLTDVRPGGPPLTLRLAHRVGDGGFVAGRLLDAAGRGLRGGRVMLDAPGFGRQVLEARAEDGTFRVGPFPPGRYRITVQDGSGGYLQVGMRAVPAAGDLDLGELQFAATSRLAVLLDHATGEDVRASLAVTASNGGGGSLTFTRRADGAYVSGPLRPGPHVLTVRGESIAPARAELEIVAGRDTEVRVPIVAASTVTLTVATPPNDTGSVDYVFVHVTDAADEKVYAQLVTLRPDTHEGSLRQGLAPGRYTLHAESPKRRLIGARPFVVPGGGEATTATVTLAPK